MIGHGRSPDLLYGVDERPPPLIAGLTALQLLALQLAYFAVPLAVARAAGLDTEQTLGFIQISWIALGAATLLQCLGAGPFGSRFLVVPVHSAVYLGPGLAALNQGGLPLLAGCFLIAGTVEITLGLLFRRLRWVFAPELVGLVVLLAGLSAGYAAVALFQQAAVDEPMAGVVMVGGAALFGSVVAAVITDGVLRRNAALFGMGMGCLLAAALGTIDLSHLKGASLLRAPALPLAAPSFAPEFLPLFAVCAIVAGFKAMGAIAAAQRANDLGWVRLEVNTVRRGVAADGAGTILAGALGTVGTNAATSSVGLSMAAGVTSRVVALPLAGLCFLAGLSGSVAVLLAAVPNAVIAATLLFSSVFTCIQGMQILTSRLLDQRRSIVVGLPFVVAVAMEARPGLILEGATAAGLASGVLLCVGLLGALVLHTLSRYGIQQRQSLLVEPGPGAIAEACRALALFGQVQGARAQVVERASTALAEALELIRGAGLADGPIAVELAFDEFNLDVELRYEGRAPTFEGPSPDARAMLDDPDAEARLASFVVRRETDRLDVQRRDSTVHLALHWEH